MIASILRGMPDDRLAAVVPTDFHVWPTKRIVRSDVIRHLIQQERARRR